ncbi:glycine receptor subunit beta-type 4-like isoform X1 [Nematostella vectensis]|uniref:glycine receptor subunit beta-type 4-like isoform X1 n=1 Tax=Nematostella vectensis TaxID=45351 RepID=UPI00207771AB|nr:glycine receptor subunit beta-type 4-like isoform X1 [Nematostella vectensis]
MDIYFRQWWVDPRFAHNIDRAFTMAGDAAKFFWTPGTYFVNAKLSSYRYVTRENMRVMIWPNGKIYFSTRITRRYSAIWTFVFTRWTPSTVLSPWRAVSIYRRATMPHS